MSSCSSIALFPLLLVLLSCEINTKVQIETPSRINMIWFEQQECSWKDGDKVLLFSRNRASTSIDRSPDLGHTFSMMRMFHVENHKGTTVHSAHTLSSAPRSSGKPAEPAPLQTSLSRPIFSTWVDWVHFKKKAFGLSLSLSHTHTHTQLPPVMFVIKTGFTTDVIQSQRLKGAVKALVS